TVGDLSGAERAQIASMLWRSDLSSASRPVGLEVDTVPDRVRGADVVLGPGKPGRRVCSCAGAIGNLLVLDAGPGELDGVAAGDEVLVDNHRFLAYCCSYLHQVDLDGPESSHFAVGGVPIYPQREQTLQDLLVGVSMKAEFDG